MEIKDFLVENEDFMVTLDAAIMMAQKNNLGTLYFKLDKWKTELLKEVDKPTSYADSANIGFDIIMDKIIILNKLCKKLQLCLYFSVSATLNTVDLHVWEDNAARKTVFRQEIKGINSKGISEKLIKLCDNCSEAVQKHCVDTIAALEDEQKMLEARLAETKKLIKVTKKTAGAQ